MEQVDVVVAGAGPVGLLAAIELALGGVRVLVLERLAAASPISKALGLGPLGSEALQRRGMSAAMAAAEARSFAVREMAGNPSGPQSEPNSRDQGPRISGHFAGLALIRAEAQKKPERPGRPVDQQAIEAMLAERARALGIEVRRACDVTGFLERGDGLDVEWASPVGGGRVRCAYLVACDGGRSSIRKMAGFAFPGTAPTLTMYTAVIAIGQAARPLPGGWHRTEGGMFSYGLFPGRLFMLDFSGPPEDREAPVTRDEIESVLRRISGADVRVEALESASRWTDNTRLADTYRRGRVLLAGDAAHVHSPFGGQGMSLGLADAANLGWKLAAVLRGAMPDTLLDTYTAERRPIADAVLANTLAQTAIMRPDPRAGAMRDIVANLLRFDDANRYLGEMVSGLAARYELGSELDEVGRLIGDRPVKDGGADTSLYEVMRDGVGVLLDASDDGRASKLADAAARGIRCVAIETGPSMLIRPDACVAWAGMADDTDGLAEALRRWFEPVASDARKIPSLDRSAPNL